MATIIWDGGTLTNAWPDTPASRFGSVEPRAAIVGQRRTLLATGAPRVWAYRTDYTATFELRDIRNTDLELALALGLHLSNAGVVEVQMGDRDDRVYPNCVLAPGAEVPFPKLSDPQALRYTMSFALLNLDSAPFLAIY